MPDSSWSRGPVQQQIRTSLKQLLVPPSGLSSTSSQSVGVDVYPNQQLCGRGPLQARVSLVLFSSGSDALLGGVPGLSTNLAPLSLALRPALPHGVLDYNMW